MNSTAKWILGVVVVVVVIWVGYTASQKDAVPGESGSQVVSAEPIKIGVIGPLSGDAAVIGQQMQRVLDYRLAEINAQKGTKFELVYEDGKCAGSDAVSAFQKLTDIDGIKLIIGGACSSETLGIAPLTREGKAVAVSALSSNPTVEGASPYVFSVSYTDQVIGETLAMQMKTFSKVAVITEQNDYNIGIKNVWEKKIAEYPNVKIVANETFPKGASDFRSILSKIRKENPEVLFLNPNVGVTAQNLLKQLAEMKDWKGYTIYSQIAYLGDDTRTSVGVFAEGMRIIDAPNLSDIPFLTYKDAIVKAKGTLSDIGNYYTASTIEALNLLTSLARELGNNPQAVQGALSTRTFTGGYLGNITFAGHSFKQGSQGGLYVVENGKAVYKP